MDNYLSEVDLNLLGKDLTGECPMAFFSTGPDWDPQLGLVFIYFGTCGGRDLNPRCPMTIPYRGISLPGSDTSASLRNSKILDF